MMPIVEIANLAILLVIVAVCLPMLATANGTRPFILENILLAALFIFNQGADILGQNPLPREVGRLYYGAVVLATLAAVALHQRRKKDAHHP